MLQNYKCFTNGIIWEESVHIEAKKAKTELSEQFHHREITMKETVEINLYPLPMTQTSGQC